MAHALSALRKPAAGQKPKDYCSWKSLFRRWRNMLQKGKAFKPKGKRTHFGAGISFTNATHSVLSIILRSMCYSTCSLDN